MPQFLSVEAQSLLRALFKRNPSNRLGMCVFDQDICYVLPALPGGEFHLSAHLLPWLSSSLGDI